ncbi:MAG: carboxypeptidase-like regulatory domain-containing protein [Acidobacteriota bacterium]
MKAVRGTWLVVAIFSLLVAATTVSAQITTGTVSGTIKDATGGVIPGATVTLVSESKNTRSTPVVTSNSGDFVFPNIAADVYTVEVTMPSFRTLKRTAVKVSGGDRVSLPAMTLEAGGTSEVVNVTAEAPLIQAQSGERSFAVSTTQVENLPINHGNFTALTAMVPGVVSGGASAGGTRLGGAGQNNIQMDGVSAMDTGNNGQMLSMNIESIAEVKVLTQGYQAEYGRSSGLQITAVTKGGSNRFHGSAYRIDTNSKWNANSWVNQKNGDPKARTRATIEGYSIGGPVGKPGGNNKLFFFHSYEFRPTDSLTNGGNPIRLRVPTAAERAGDFSGTLDNNGALFNTIKDPLLNGTCTSTNQAACFKDGGVLGKIPANRLYAPGIALMSRYPLPNVTQAAGANYNYEVAPASFHNLLRQPAIRVDYQFSPALRVTAKYSGQRQTKLVTPGTLQGFNDVLNPYPFITNYGITANYTLNSTTFVEATYGFIRNQLAGGGSGGILVNPASNRLDAANGLTGLPLLYPDAGVVDQRYYAYKTMQDLNPVWWDGTRINLPQTFGWGTRIGAAVPNQQFPGFLNINRTQDIAGSLTKVAGRHTMKFGAYNNHSYKAQNTGAGGVANLSFQGFINFGNDTNNPIDSGFGYSNAALGVFSQYLQQSQLIEGSMLYNNTEFYAQDNWKVNSRLTLDYGVRFTRQQPQYDQFLQMSNFFPNLWASSAAPVFYTAGCSNGAVTCAGTSRVAKNPLSGQLLAAGSAAAIGTPVPNTGDLTNGIRQAGQGISKYSYTWPTMVYGPRVGAAYDLTGTQSIVVRGGGGLFYDRPDGNTVFSIPGFPIATSQDVRNGTLQTVGTGLSFVPVPSLVVFQYNAKVPSSVQWNAGVQMALPWSSSLDVSYVGNHGYNRLGAFQGGTTVNLNAVDFGTAYLPQYQDSTLTASAVPGATSLPDNSLRPYRGFGNINQNTTDFYDTYHSVQTSYNRRFRSGLQFGVNYTLGLQLVGNTGLQQRLQHNADGTYSVRADQAQYEAQNKNLDNRRHTLKANWVWDLPDVRSENGALRALGFVVNDWQLSGILTTGSNGHYDLSYTYNTDGANKNITGSPDYAGKLAFVGDPGKGCSDNQYAQFNTASVAGPTYGSVGLESGRNLLLNCPDHTVDLAIARNIRVGGGRQLQLRLDAFNAFNVSIITARVTQVQYNSPTNQTLRNSQTLADGSVDPTKLTPKTAGFGAATGAQTMRNLQMTARFSF